MGRLGHQVPCSCRCLLLVMCLREKEKETGLAEAHDGDWDAERGPRLQWTGMLDVCRCWSSRGPCLKK